MPDRITVGRLRRELAGYSDDTEIDFGSTLAGTPLIYCRVKKRGPELVQIELAEHRDAPPTSSDSGD